MSRVHRLVLAAACLAPCLPATAGPFLLPEGQGQFIGGVGYVESARRFDQRGIATPAPTYRKAEASGYLEYGLSPSLTLIAAPTLAHQNGTAANTITGSDSSAFGARVRLFEASGTVVAVQALVQPPTGNSDGPSQIAAGGANAFATDIRVQFGRSFTFFGMATFVALEPGVRLHTEPLPNEARLDTAIGVHATSRLMVLGQTFSAWAPSDGPLVQRASYTKVQASLVYDLSARWSLQAGAFRTISGENALRETGPFAAAWYRF